MRDDRGDFDAATSCGPAGVVTLSYEGASSACNGNGCWAFLTAAGGAAAGLPEQGEIHPGWNPRHEAGPPTPPPPGTVFTRVQFALVGDAPLAGAVPAAVVRRICRAAPSAPPGVVDVSCTGDVPEAACSGTLTLRAAP